MAYLFLVNTFLRGSRAGSVVDFCISVISLRGCEYEDALLILSERKRIPSEPSALNQLNNEHDDGNHEQKMNQTAAKVADKAQQPEHH
jgi:hypothetical protein